MALTCSALVNAERSDCYEQARSTLSKTLCDKFSNQGAAKRHNLHRGKPKGPAMRAPFRGREGRSKEVREGGKPASEAPLVCLPQAEPERAWVRECLDRGSAPMFCRRKC